eukprot:CAMPEP_0176368264 /NCGR_PEP_ID=MMETSP0126-20121128/22476_1 /TAXON_ID=141414 ORGANISM="Strombidinopsis acuminatum, Strain SPMC142" /NCGR_SAMPLE_ID=MMETSP0126 /ASSEMBLY_ACC=CAM_ASM_000229 /LENGTH=110 /DNA_ID=CAMNT_0017726451 /DNA_START=105 /DNA_END=437 /DNA_ORIENTATION=+
MTEEVNEILLENKGARDATFDDFKAAMPADEPRYAIYDLEYNTEDGRKESKLLFIMYSPDSCVGAKGRTLKFAYANNKETLKNKCNPTHRELQVNDHEDIKEASWVADCQ